MTTFSAAVFIAKLAAISEALKEDEPNDVVWNILWLHTRTRTHTRSDTLQANTTSKLHPSLPVTCCAADVGLDVAIIFYVPDEPGGLDPAALHLLPCNIQTGCGSVHSIK